MMRNACALIVVFVATSSAALAQVYASCFVYYGEGANFDVQGCWSSEEMGHFFS